MTMGSRHGTQTMDFKHFSNTVEKIRVAAHMVQNKDFILTCLVLQERTGKEKKSELRGYEQWCQKVRGDGTQTIAGGSGPEQMRLLLHHEEGQRKDQALMLANLSTDHCSLPELLQRKIPCKKQYYLIYSSQMFAKYMLANNLLYILQKTEGLCKTDCHSVTWQTA